ncbi:hypothetical protein [Paludibacterium yongneupense]|uniref:hypothetical protein n=1 Tax=Paludibacterium yongneupense TaxID=400061 RepID=UPI000427502A|nr:hypothetical protein [Paludibacterium yongneupense]
MSQSCIRCTVAAFALVCASAGATDDEGTPVSLLNVGTGAAVTIWYDEPGHYLWGYPPHDTRRNRHRLWTVIYRSDGSLSLRNPTTRSCMENHYREGIVNRPCRDIPKQRFLPLLSHDGGVMLQNGDNGACLHAYAGFYAHAFSINFRTCPVSGAVAAGLLWILGPPLQDSVLP